MIPANEYNEYYKRYIDKTSEPSLTKALLEGKDATVEFFQSIPSEKFEYAYDEGKWTPKEILLHLIDTERVFMYRALQFSRADNVELEGFDQDVFANNANGNQRAMNDLINEYAAVRNSSIQFYKGCSPEVMTRMGVASNSPLSVRAAGYITCGHEIHHIQIIKERYL